MADESSLNSSLARNIEALRQRRIEEEANAAFEQRVARSTTRFSGRIDPSAHVHAALYGGWIAANSV